MPLTAPRRVQYPRPWEGVNRRRAFLLFFTTTCGLGLASVGCTNTLGTRSADHWIAARYDVEPRLIGANLATNDSIIRSDFKTIAALGFDGVVLCHVEDGDRTTLLHVAGEVSLRAAVPDRKFERFVVTGALPSHCGDLNHLVGDAPYVIAHHPAFNGYVLNDGRGPAARERSRKLRAQLSRAAIPYASLEGDEKIRPAVIEARSLRDGLPGTAVERLFAQYHAALSAGRTGDLVVDRFTRLPGDPPGLTSAEDPLLPAHSSAIAALVQRARCWGPRLCGLSVTPLDRAAADPSGLTVTAFGRGSRRYVLVFNPSTDRFLREQVRLPVSIPGLLAVRAVEVPPSTDRAGRVIHTERSGLTLPVELRPGDAALFEIFSREQ